MRKLTIAEYFLAVLVCVFLVVVVFLVGYNYGYGSSAVDARMDPDIHRAKLKSRSVRGACNLFGFSLTNLPPSTADLVQDMREDTKTSLTLLVDVKRQLYDARATALGSQYCLTNDIEPLLEHINSTIEGLSSPSQAIQQQAKK